MSGKALGGMDKSQDQEEILARVLDKYRAGDSGALRDMEQLLAVSRPPASWSVLGNYAWLLTAEKRYEEAIERYKELIAQCPENVELYWRLGDRLNNVRRFDEAVQAFRQALAIAPDCLDASIGIRYAEYLRKCSEPPSEENVPDRPQQTGYRDFNLKLNAEELEARATRLRSLPPWIHIESTTRCNFRCRTCLKGYGPYYAEDLHRDVLDKIRRDLMPVNTRVSITGYGEPTMSSCFDELLDMCIANGSGTEFVTNASLLTFPRLEKLMQCPLDIKFSIDGATKETYEAIRPGASFDRLLEKLAMVKKVRDTHPHSSPATLGINMVGVRLNIHELPEMVRLAHRFGITHVGVADYSLTGSEFDEQSLRFEPARANRCFEAGRLVALELGIVLHTPPPFEEQALSPSARTSLLDRIRRAKTILPEPRRFPRCCHTPWSEPYICTDGRVMPCCLQSTVLGNLKKQDIRQIWNGWRYRVLRFRVNSIMPPLYCRDCFVCWGVSGGNPANTRAKEGLIVKALYFIEERVVRWAATHGVWPYQGPTGREANYYQGRPLQDNTMQR